MANTQYRGLYLVRDENKKITGFQVLSCGIEIPLSVKDYIERDVLPELSKLPEKKDYFQDKNQWCFC
ncbi:MAG: hypothetical protein HGA52_04490 [Bacteroidales bacterium]|nr:hypothetical protein [Bacteroidales bacterium]